MASNPLDDRIRAVIARELGARHDAILPDVTFDQLGADSLDVFEIGLVLETEFGIEIPDDEIKQWRTVTNVLAYMNKACYPR